MKKMKIKTYSCEYGYFVYLCTLNMKRRFFHIFHFFNLGLIYMAISILLIVNSGIASAFTLLPSQESKEEKNPSEKKSSKTATLQKTSIEVSSPITTFQLQPAFVLIFCWSFPIIGIIQFTKIFPVPLFPALQYTFEHHIAIHAP